MQQLPLAGQRILIVAGAPAARKALRARLLELGANVWALGDSSAPDQNFDLERAYDLMFGVNREKKSDFYAWPLYDWVIIGSYWVTSGKALPAGFALAHVSTCELSHFQTPKLVVDLTAVEAADKAQLDESQEIFDEGNSAFVYCQSINNAIEVLTGRNQPLTQGKDVLSKKSASSDYLESALLKTFAGLGRFIVQRLQETTDLMFVDDEQEILKEILSTMGLDSACIDSANLQHVAGVVTLQRKPNTAGYDCCITSVRHVDEVVKLTEHLVKGISGQKPARSLILVTDIRIRGWPENGIELIHRVRSKINDANYANRLSTIAFTGFPTSIVTVTAARRGADLVVSKGFDSGEHGSASPFGLRRLMLSLGWICFQIETLRDARIEALALSDETQSPERIHEVLDRLARILPVHSVAKFLEKERSDTMHLLEVIAAFPPQSSTVRSVKRKIQSLYDDGPA